MDRLFVYGTLRRGCGNGWASRLHQASDYEGPATIAGSLYRIAHYPGWVEDSNQRVVHGELWRPRDFTSLIVELDNYEGADYRRVKRPVRKPTGETVDAWIYLFTAPISGKLLIPSGDWLAGRPLE